VWRKNCKKRRKGVKEWEKEEKGKREGEKKEKGKRQETSLWWKKKENDGYWLLDIGNFISVWLCYDDFYCRVVFSVQHPTQTYLSFLFTLIAFPLHGY